MSLWSKFDLLSAFFYLSSLLICGHSYLFSIAQLKESIALSCVLVFDLLSLVKGSEFATSSSRPSTIYLWWLLDHFIKHYVILSVLVQAHVALKTESEVCIG